MAGFSKVAFHVQAKQALMIFYKHDDFGMRNMGDSRLMVQS